MMEFLFWFMKCIIFVILVCLLVCSILQQNSGKKMSEIIWIFINLICCAIVLGCLEDWTKPLFFDSSEFVSVNAPVNNSSSGFMSRLGLVSESSSFPEAPFMVRVLIDNLNIYSDLSGEGEVNGQTGKGSFTIVEVANGWGRLKSGAGWIYLGNPSYCEIVK